MSSAAVAAEVSGMTMALAVGVVQAGSCRGILPFRLPRASASPWERGDQLIAEMVGIPPLVAPLPWGVAAAAPAGKVD